MDNEFLDSEKAQNTTNGTELGLFAIARSLNNLAIALSEEDTEEDDDRYFIRDIN